MDTAALVTVIAQFCLGGAAWRLANTLKKIVNDHETRIGVLESDRKKA